MLFMLAIMRPALQGQSCVLTIPYRQKFEMISYVSRAKEMWDCCRMSVIIKKHHNVWCREVFQMMSGGGPLKLALPGP